jgi:hypothetical protein
MEIDLERGRFFAIAIDRRSARIAMHRSLLITMTRVPTISRFGDPNLILSLSCRSSVSASVGLFDASTPK